MEVKQQQTQLPPEYLQLSLASLQKFLEHGGAVVHSFDVPSKSLQERPYTYHQWHESIAPDSFGVAEQVEKLDEEEMAITTLEEQITHKLFEQYLDLTDPQTIQ